MTELERQLMIALRRLSEQYETEQQQRAEEQRRHSEQLEALQSRIERQDAESGILRQRIERLDAQVTGLAQDYGTLAETLRELWR